jgi:diadenosine tetraphosphate (Ap4A) HIT family hydrolase
MSCPLCERTQKILKNEYPYLVQEFEESYLLLGEHQYYKGYCVLLSKSHFREMTDMPSDRRQKLFNELMLAHQAIQNVFKPKKMNLSSLGNVVDHIHWHLFPRYENDPNFKNPPWLHGAKLTQDEAHEVIKMLKAEVQNLLSSVS